MTLNDLRRPQLRALQYFYIDGSFEFGFGLMSLSLALFFYLEAHVQGWLSALVDASLILVMIGGAWLVRRLTGWLKEQVTYPRGGYAAYPRKQGRRRGIRLLIGAAAGGLAAVLAVVLTADGAGGPAAMPILSGVLLGLVLAFIGWRARLSRFYLLGGLSAAAGLYLGWSGLGNEPGLMVYYLAFGLILFASGGLTLRAYLRSTPGAGGGPEEEQAS
jgi:hypothetical protein